MNLDNIDWDKVNGLVPAIVQDFKSSQVLMLGYMNKEALENTVNTNFVHSAVQILPIKDTKTILIHHSKNLGLVVVVLEII